MDNSRLIQLEKDVAYLYQEIEDLVKLFKQKSIEIHYHYHNEFYGDQFIKENPDDLLN
jgi:hypothetical protein